jgi:hypothetical protein
MMQAEVEREGQEFDQLILLAERLRGQSLGVGQELGRQAVQL